MNSPNHPINSYSLIKTVAGCSQTPVFIVTACLINSHFFYNMHQQIQSVNSYYDDDDDMIVFTKLYLCTHILMENYIIMCNGFKKNHHSGKVFYT